jgi:hypothetical protein
MKTTYLYSELMATIKYIKIRVAFDDVISTNCN